MIKGWIEVKCDFCERVIAFRKTAFATKLLCPECMNLKKHEMEE